MVQERSGEEIGQRYGVDVNMSLQTCNLEYVFFLFFSQGMTPKNFEKLLLACHHNYRKQCVRPRARLQNCPYDIVKVGAGIKADLKQKMKEKTGDKRKRIQKYLSHDQKVCRQ